MNSNEKALARIMFEHKVYTSTGQAYEDLFVSIMQKAIPNFIPVKPQGKIGDRKNDGYDKKNGSYYQVFAPEAPSESESKAVNKLIKDFAGLKTHWDPIYKIKEFFFVFNDKYKGSFPTIEEDLATIGKEHNLQNCGVFLAKHLEDFLFNLSDDIILRIVGYIPDPEKIQFLNYSVLAQVIAHIQKNKQPLKLSKLLAAPYFDIKIEFNGIGNQVSALLKTASYQVGVLEEYFENNSDFLKQEIRNKLNSIYQESKLKEFGTVSGINRSDLLFFDILKQIIPPECESETTQNAALVLMAYFFEACDIFEEPLTT